MPEAKTHHKQEHSREIVIWKLCVLPIFSFSEVVQSTPWSVLSQEHDDKRNNKFSSPTVSQCHFMWSKRQKGISLRVKHSSFKRSSKSDLCSVVAGKHYKGQNTLKKTRKQTDTYCPWGRSSEHHLQIPVSERGKMADGQSAVSFLFFLSLPGPSYSHHNIHFLKYMNDQSGLSSKNLWQSGFYKAKLNP